MDVISSLAGNLDAELEKARETLKGVDSNIKKLFGKDASELNQFARNRRSGDVGTKDEMPHVDEDMKWKTRTRDDRDREDEPAEKRRRHDRNAPIVIGPRLGGYREHNEPMDLYYGARRLQSRVVSSGKEKSREEVLDEQRSDQNGRERNRRMFGALLGTLQKFKQDESKLKEKEDKRALIEAKIDETEKVEKEEVRREKQKLIRDRKQKVTEIKRLEIKRTRIQELEIWENKTKYLTNFIRTESRPHIFYIPRVMNPITECRLEASRVLVSEMIANKRKLVLEDLEDYDMRSNKYRENRDHNPRNRDVHMNMDEELDAIMKSQSELTADDDGNKETEGKENLDLMTGEVTEQHVVTSPVSVKDPEFIPSQESDEVSFVKEESNGEVQDPTPMLDD